MTAPAPVAEQLLQELAPLLEDHTIEISEFELRRIEARISDAIRSAPSPHDVAVLYNLRGTVCVRRGQRQDALAEFLKAARLDTGVAQFATNVANAMLQLGQLSEAEKWLDDAKRRPQRDPAADFAIALNEAALATKAGHQDAADEAMDRAIALTDPADAYSQVQLAVYLAVLGRADDAAEFVARYIALSTRTDLGETLAITFIRNNPEHLRALSERSLELAAALQEVAERYDAPREPDALVPYVTATPPTEWARIVAAAKPASASRR
ncbi:MAG: hypothetical protein U0324_45515 [Polyangiales bacterium]